MKGQFQLSLNSITVLLRDNEQLVINENLEAQHSLKYSLELCAQMLKLFVFCFIFTSVRCRIHLGYIIGPWFKRKM